MNPTASTSALPPSITDKPTYPLADPWAPDLFLQQLNAQKLAAVKAGDPFGARPVEGIEGERKPDVGHEDVEASGSRSVADGMQVDA